MIRTGKFEAWKQKITIKQRKVFTQLRNVNVALIHYLFQNNNQRFWSAATGKTNNSNIFENLSHQVLHQVTQNSYWKYNMF